DDAQPIKTNGKSTSAISALTCVIKFLLLNCVIGYLRYLVQVTERVEPLYLCPLRPDAAPV
ncbi:MAG: hypothetical protein K0U93_16950, partial [Gammaproteobacteria bacterium]|nr:hypothetical protein [Gammaproteobacteria bacterium]